MTKLILIAFLSFSFSVTNSQNVLVFKKRGKDIKRYWQGSTIAFQLANSQWQKGEITKIQKDSLYIRPMVVRYSLMGTDTVHYGIKGFALTDIYALPNKGILIDYKEGHYQVSRTGGHVHFYWVKSGWIFRVGAAGYAALHIANGLIKDDLSISDSKIPLLSAAAVFLGGVLLHRNYKPYLKIGRRYQVEIIKLSDQKH